MGTICTVIDSFNSGIKVGTVFKSKRDVCRAMPKGVGTRVGLDIGGRQVQFRRTEKMIFIEDLGKVPGMPTIHSPNSGLARSTRRPGRTAWKVEDARTSGLQNGKVFASRQALVIAAKVGSEFIASDVATDVKYRFTVNAATFRMSPIA